MSRRARLKRKKTSDELDSDYDPSSELPAKRRRIKASRSTSKSNRSKKPLNQKPDSTFWSSSTSTSGHKRKRVVDLPRDDQSGDYQQEVQSNQNQESESFDRRRRFIEKTCKRNKAKIKQLRKSNSTQSTRIVERPLNCPTDDNQQDVQNDQHEESESFDTLRKRLITLRGRNNEINEIWKKGKKSGFCDWFSGKPVQVDGKELIISFEDFIKNFESALLAQSGKIIKGMWKKNSLLLDYFSSKPINYHDRRIPIISLKDLIHYFKMILSSTNTKIIKAIWKNNKLLRAYFNGKPVNYDGEDKLAIIPDKHVTNFKLALVSRNNYVIKIMWRKSELLKDRIRQLETKNIEEIRTIVYRIVCHCDQEFVNEYIKWVKSDKKSVNIMAKLIREIDSSFSKKSNKWREHGLKNLKIFKTNLPNIPSQVISNSVSSDFYSLRKELLTALMGRETKTISAIWKDAKNTAFRSWFCGMSVTHKSEEVSPIPLNELIKNFKAALKSAKSYVINKMLAENFLLNPYFNGRSIDYHGQEVQAISQKKLVKNFKVILTSRYQKLINETWEKNELLKKAIKNCDINEAQEVLRTVLVGQSEITPFIKSYLNWVENIDVIAGVLEKIRSGYKKTKLKTERINLLKARLKELLKKRIDELDKASNEWKKENTGNYTSEQDRDFVTENTGDLIHIQRTRIISSKNKKELVDSDTETDTDNDSKKDNEQDVLSMNADSIGRDSQQHTNSYQLSSSTLFKHKIGARNEKNQAEESYRQNNIELP